MISLQDSWVFLFSNEEAMHLSELWHFSKGVVTNGNETQIFVYRKNKQVSKILEHDLETKPLMKTNKRVLVVT